MEPKHSSLANCIAVMLLILLGMAGRLLPHPPNFTPLAGMALFAGWFFPTRFLAASVPLAVMVCTDVFWLGTYDSRIMTTVYASLVFPVLLRSLVNRGRWRWARIGSCAIAGSIVFFLTTNFAVWAWGMMYDHTISGLVRCYVAGMPFFANTLAGDLFWSAGIFGSYALAHGLLSASMTARETTLLEGVRFVSVAQ